MAMTNQEKSAVRNHSLNDVAKRILKFSAIQIKRPEKPTWRQLETALKTANEAGAEIEIVIRYPKSPTE